MEKTYKYNIIRIFSLMKNPHIFLTLFKINNFLLKWQGNLNHDWIYFMRKTRNNLSLYPGRSKKYFEEDLKKLMNIINNSISMI
jgi:hypothetical protein